MDVRLFVKNWIFVTYFTYYLIGKQPVETLYLSVGYDNDGDNRNSLTVKGSATSGSEDYQVGDSMELPCVSDYEIEWIWPNNSIYRDWSDPVAEGRLTVSPLKKIQNKYTTTLQVRNLRSTDTGSYVCRTKTKNKMVENYVFVKDKNSGHLFLHWKDEESAYSHLISFFENLASYIDCLVTDPTAEVDLYIRSRNLEMSNSYDPRKGFYIAPHQLAVFSLERGATARCVARTPDGVEDEVKFLLLGITVSNEISITVNDTGAKHPYKGGKLEMYCKGIILKLRDTFSQLSGYCE